MEHHPRHAADDTAAQGLGSVGSADGFACLWRSFVKKQKALSPIERFIALSDQEKEAEVAPYENGTDRTKWRPLTPAQRRQWAGIKRTAGRPRVGQGAKIVPVSIERGLLKKADSFARRHKLKRSQMVAQGLRLVMQKAG